MVVDFTRIVSLHFSNKTKAGRNNSYQSGALIELELHNLILTLVITKGINMHFTRDYK